MFKHSIHWLQKLYAKYVDQQHGEINNTVSVTLNPPQPTPLIEFIWDQHDHPRMLVIHDAQQLEPHWIASLINGEIKNSHNSAQNLLQHIEQALDDVDYYWSGTSNSLEIIVTHDKVELLPLYKQFNGSKEIQHQSLKHILIDWIEFIHAGTSH